MIFCIEAEVIRKIFEEKNIFYEKDFAKCDCFITLTPGNEKVIIVFNPLDAVSIEKAKKLAEILKDYNVELQEGYFIKSKKILYSIFRVSPQIIILSFSPDKKDLVGKLIETFYPQSSVEQTEIQLLEKEEQKQEEEKQEERKQEEEKLFRKRRRRNE